MKTYAHGIYAILLPTGELHRHKASRLPFLYDTLAEAQRAVRIPKESQIITVEIIGPSEELEP